MTLKRKPLKKAGYKFCEFEEEKEMNIDWNTIEGYREDMSADEKLELLNNYDPPAAAPIEPEPAPAPAEPKNADPAPAPAAKSAAKTNPLMAEVAWKRERDKLTSENGNLRKELRKYMTEQQAREAERQAEMEARDAELKALRRDKTLSDLTANFLGRSYDENLARQGAEALADGDTNALFDIMAQRDMAYEKALRAKILAETPKPPASDPNSEEAKRKDKENLRRLFGLPSTSK